MNDKIIVNRARDYIHGFAMIYVGGSLVKKGLAFMLLMAIAFLFTGIRVESKNNTAKPKLNRKNITLQVGKTFKLKLLSKKEIKSKISWKSNNKKIATVSKKGLVRAKKVGITKVIAKYKKQVVKCKIKVVKRENKVGKNKTTINKVTTNTIVTNNGNNKNEATKPYKKPSTSPSATPIPIPIPAGRTPEPTIDPLKLNLKEGFIKNSFEQDSMVGR